VRNKLERKYLGISEKYKILHGGRLGYLEILYWTL
jgi:hypothetical protein